MGLDMEDGLIYQSIDCAYQSDFLVIFISF